MIFFFKNEILTMREPMVPLGSSGFNANLRVSEAVVTMTSPCLFNLNYSYKELVTFMKVCVIAI